MPSYTCSICGKDIIPGVTGTWTSYRKDGYAHTSCLPTNRSTVIKKTPTPAKEQQENQNTWECRSCGTKNSIKRKQCRTCLVTR